MSDTWGADNSNNKKAAKTIATTLTMATTRIIITVTTVLIWICVDEGLHGPLYKLGCTAVMGGSMDLCID